MRKKQKGFTLIELLVTIALMLSILGIAIVSFINISDRKKEESWGQVKEQIETAATEYFTSNEYLFEGLEDLSSGIISVGRLVSDDYLNKVTNPKTGKSVSMCAVVTVQKTGDKLTAKFDDGTENSTQTNCDSDNSIIIKSPGAPSFNTSDVCRNKDGADIGNDAGGWCFSKEFSLENIVSNGTITSIKHCSESGMNCIPDIEDGIDTRIKINGLDRTSSSAVTAISISNQTGTTTIYRGYKIDRKAPYGSVTLSKNSNENYNSNRPKISIAANDDESGLFSASFDRAKNSSTGNSRWNISEFGNSWTQAVEHFTIYKGPGLTNQYSNGSGDKVLKGDIALTVTDKVGNVGTLDNNEYALYKRCDEKNSSISTTWSGSCSNKCGGTENGSKYKTYTDKHLGGTCGSPEYAGADSRSCGGKTVKNYSYSCTNECGGGTKYKTPNYVSSMDNNHSCGSGKAVADGSCGGKKVTKTVDKTGYGSCAADRKKYKTVTDYYTSTYNSSKSCGTVDRKASASCDVCEGFGDATKSTISGYVSVSVSGRDLLNKDLYDVNSSHKDYNRVRFTFDGINDNEKIKFDSNVSAVWNSSSVTTTTSWHSGWNTSSPNQNSIVKDTWCVTKFDCHTGSHSTFYVTACAYAKCGNKTKKICYSATAYRSKSVSAGGFTYVGN